jgi:dTDP-4-dehydrorhamnose reductase
VRVAVTGPGGRLGRALMAALADAPFAGLGGPIGWGRPDYDLDDPAAAGRLVERDRPELVIHAAAWTDTEACAREPDLCRRRNGDATGELAAACAARWLDLVIVSTNEVFDGRRGDGQGYAVDDAPNPINPYGASKLAGERAATEAFRGAGSSLAIVRTAWLYGPPGNDFPAKILAAADRARQAGEPLRVVGDEIGSPTFAPDLAEAIVELAGSGSNQGVHHVVNAGAVSRAGWARELLRQCRMEVPIEEISAATWTRASAAPAWAVLQPTPLPGGEPLRSWQAALADYVPSLLRPRPAGAR